MSIFHFLKKLLNKNIQYFKKCRELFSKKIRISLHDCSKKPVADCCCSISPRCKDPPSLASNLDIKLDIREKDIKVDVYMRCLGATLYKSKKFSLKRKKRVWYFILFFLLFLTTSTVHHE